MLTSDRIQTSLIHTHIRYHKEWTFSKIKKYRKTDNYILPGLSDNN